MVPLFADQFENARRIAATRAGQVRAAVAPELTRAIEDVLGDGTYRDRARAIAAEMAATASVDEVLARLPSGRR
jgi:UDP:flavonoid glycosyltransferase YjiC (YdhE family)